MMVLLKPTNMQAVIKVLKKKDLAITNLICWLIYLLFTEEVVLCGDSTCHDKARCVYNSDLQIPMCECNTGFTGDGTRCEPIRK